MRSNTSIHWAELLIYYVLCKTIVVSHKSGNCVFFFHLSLINVLICSDHLKPIAAEERRIEEEEKKVREEQERIAKQLAEGILFT